MKSIIKFILLFFSLCIIPAMDYSMERQKHYLSPEQMDRLCIFIEQCTNNNKYTCPACPDKHETSKSDSFRKHLLGIHIHPFSCNICLQELRAPYMYDAKQLNNCTGNGGKHEIIPNINIEKNLQQLLNPSEYSREKSDSASNKDHRLLRPPVFSDEQNKLICRLIKICTNNNKYICPSPSCSTEPEMNNRNSFRKHLLHFHIHPFSCSTCNRELKVTSRTRAMQLTDCINPGGKHTIVTNTKNIDIHIQQLLNQAEKSSTEQPEVEECTHQNNHPEIKEVHIDDATWDSLFRRNSITYTPTDHAQENNGNLSANTSFNSETSVITNNQPPKETVSESTSEKSSAEEHEVEECHQNKRPRTEESSFHQSNIQENIEICSSNTPILQRIKMFSDKQNKDISTLIKKCNNNNNKYRCPSPSCIKEHEMDHRNYFRNHLLTLHIHPFSCSACRQQLKARCKQVAMKLTGCIKSGGRHTVVTNTNTNIDINIQQLLNQSEKSSTEKPEVGTIHQNKRPRRGESPFDQSISPQDSSTTAMEISQHAQPIDNDHAQGNIENLPANTSTFNTEPSVVVVTNNQPPKETVSESKQEELIDEENIYNFTHYDEDLLGL